MAQPQRPHRKKNMTDEELKVWLLSQCEEQPAPYPALEEPCVLWTGCLHRSGYGMVTYHGQTRRVHRVMFRIVHGRWPTDTLCHKCDRPACINLAHVFEGSQQENMADMVQKQRQAAKLDEEKVREIRALAGQGLLQREIGARFGLRQAQVSQIVRRERWRHIA